MTYIKDKRKSLQQITDKANYGNNFAVKKLSDMGKIKRT